MSDSSVVAELTSMCVSRSGRALYSNLSMSFPKGKITAILGPSGCGKTTLLKVLGGSVPFDRGEVVVNGVDVGKCRRESLYELRKQMGILYQQGALFTHLNVFDNVAFPLREHTNLSENMIRVLVLAKLEAVGLRGAYQLSIQRLSGGMARRVALARALILDPSLMMYDEPFTGQDPITRGVLSHLIAKLNQALSLSSILVTHNVSETKKIADYVYVLAHGEVIGQGTVEEVFANTDPRVQQFLAGAPDGPVAFRYPSDTMASDLGVEL